MKWIICFLLTALLSFSACLYLPWWTIAIVAGVVAAVIPQPPIKAFLSGFLALFLLWTLLSYAISSNNEHILAHRMSLLLLESDSPGLLILITGCLGGVVAGLAALATSFLVYKRQGRDVSERGGFAKSSAGFSQGSGR